MNATLWRENPKQCSFLRLIYVNHESFHKWNKRCCECLVGSIHAHPGSPTQIHPCFWQLLPVLRNMPPGTFFPLSTYFSFNCQCAPCSNCSHTLRNILLGNTTTVTLAPVQTRATQHSLGHEEERGRGAWVLFRETKDEELWAKKGKKKNFLKR